MFLEPLSHGAAVDGPATLMSLRLSTDTEPPTVVVAGEVDTDTADRLLDAVGDLARSRRPGSIGIDLRAVTFLDSAGIRALVQAHAEAERGGCRVVLTGASAAVHRVLAISGLTGHLGLTRAGG